MSVRFSFLSSPLLSSFPLSPSSYPCPPPPDLLLFSVITISHHAHITFNVHPPPSNFQIPIPQTPKPKHAIPTLSPNNSNQTANQSKQIQAQTNTQKMDAIAQVINKSSQSQSHALNMNPNLTDRHPSLTGSGGGGFDQQRDHVVGEMPQPGSGQRSVGSTGAGINTSGMKAPTAGAGF